METKTRKRWPVEERQQQFVEIALELFGKRPFDEISMDDIANQAGVTKGLLYRYFKSKRELYLAVLRTSAGEMFSATEPDPSQSPVEQLLSSIDAYLTTIEQHPERYLMFIKSGVGFDEEVWNIIEEFHALYVQRIVTAATQSSCESPILEISINGWIGFVERTVVRWLATDRQVPREQLRDMLSINLATALLTAKQLDESIELVELNPAELLNK